MCSETIASVGLRNQLTIIRIVKVLLFLVLQLGCDDNCIAFAEQ